MNDTWRSKYYNKLELDKSMKIQLKDQTKKTKKEKIETWFAKKLNMEKILMGGWLAIDMHGTWHPIPFDEYGMPW